MAGDDVREGGELDVAVAVVVAVVDVVIDVDDIDVVRWYKSLGMKHNLVIIKFPRAKE